MFSSLPVRQNNKQASIVEGIEDRFNCEQRDRENEEKDFENERNYDYSQALIISLSLCYMQTFYFRFNCPAECMCVSALSEQTIERSS